MNQKTQMEKMIADGYGNLAGLVIYHNGKKEYENYFHGGNADESRHVFSVTKSIVGLLIGIAVGQEKIKNIDQKILDFYPDYQVPAGEKTLPTITIRDMLTMTVPYKYKTEPYLQYFTSDDWVKESLNLMGGSKGVGKFFYAPIIGMDVLSGILTCATGQHLLDYAKENLFIPLGIEVGEDIYFHNEEEQRSYYEQKKTSGWVCGPTDVNTGGWGLSLKTADMAKIGQLCLNRGYSEECGKQIIPSTWIDAMSTEYHRAEELNLGYGYLWPVWNEHTYAAMGDGGNIIYVNKKEKLVIAISSYQMVGAKDRRKLIEKYIEPVFLSE